YAAIYDFTYSTYMALSLLQESPELLVNHVESTRKSDRLIIRVPRTHDGILLRSKLLHEKHKSKLLNFAKENNLNVRISGGSPYELNCSAPFLYSLIAPNIKIENIILFTIAITGFMPGWCYFYLPYVMG